MRYMSKDEAMKTLHQFGATTENEGIGISKSALNDWVVKFHDSGYQNKSLFCFCQSVKLGNENESFYAIFSAVGPCFEREKSTRIVTQRHENSCG